MAQRRSAAEWIAYSVAQCSAGSAHGASDVSAEHTAGSYLATTATFESARATRRQALSAAPGDCSMSYQAFVSVC